MFVYICKNFLTDANNCISVLSMSNYFIDARRQDFLAFLVSGGVISFWLVEAISSGRLRIGALVTHGSGRTRTWRQIDTQADCLVAKISSDNALEAS
jgi:hypothetical protein